MSVLFPKQIRRLSFAVRLGVFFLIPPISSLVFRLMWGVPEDWPHGPAIRVSMWLVSLILIAYAMIFIVVPRLRDVSISPLLALLALLPFINLLLFIFLAFAPSGRNARHYWEALQNRRKA
jgi:uncharacterized membrane protein YhaH (DUF805 family)